MRGSADDAMLDALERQATSCRHLGSDLYAAILDGLAADHRDGGRTRQLLFGASDRPVHDATPLRLLGALHRLALTGSAPALADIYPSCGGTWDGGDPTGRVLATIDDHEDEVRQGLAHQVQTNEVGRAPAVAAAMAHVTRIAGAPLRILEVGASAGLLSQWPAYRFDTGTSSIGPDDAPLRFGPDWFDDPAPELGTGAEVVERAASDAHPVALDDEGALRLQSFVWPDQVERMGRLRAAIEIAAASPLVVESADAGEWLAGRLSEPPDDRIATVVFHTIVWQYLPETTRQRLRAALGTAGTWADGHRSVHWVRMEPFDAQHAELRLTSWPDGEERVLARVGYHGRGLRWMERAATAPDH